LNFGFASTGRAPFCLVDPEQSSKPYVTRRNAPNNIEQIAGSMHIKADSCVFYRGTNGPKDVCDGRGFVRQPLREQIKPKHLLVGSADLIKRDRVGTSMSESFISRRGRPATSPRLIADLLYLQHAFAVSDEEVLWEWPENAYWQVVFAD
jgi:hypothetical protein